MVELAEHLDLETPQERLLKELCTILSGYLDQTHIFDIVRTYEYSANAHMGQYRKSGEAYICHPLSVAIILAEMRMDCKGIKAAILHDVIEDTEATKEEIEKTFNSEVAEMVDGVTKLTKIDNKTRAEAQAENVRKMFLAMNRDLRVIMVKLADRLHNMRTLVSVEAQRKRRIARETLEIYAPIAHRLGMNKVRHELESLGFSAMYPMRYRILDASVKKARGNRREIVETIQSSIKNRFLEAGLVCTITGREKNVYSIYLKMLQKKITFSDVSDVYAFRITCQKIDDCYRSIGIVHNLFKPIPGRFKDYIALPKTNGYQSLHTVLVGPFGVPIEIQIRTDQMHQMAESGIAAHWLYKSDDNDSTFQSLANEWIRDLLEIHKSAGDSLDFIDNLKIDLFPQEVFVFTPHGSIIKLPRNATVVDFAYAVHTDIGNSCVSARIDRQLIPLQTQLENGVTVEIITADWARPNPVWLNYIVTAKARSGIRTYLRNFKQQEAISLGKRLLEKELQAMNLQLDKMPEKRIQQLLEAMSITSMDNLLENIGLGNSMPFLVARRLCQDDVFATIKLDDNEKGVQSPLTIKGTEGMVVTLAKCCHPIPGDSIIGFFNPGRGIVVHHHECRNSKEVKKGQAGWLEVEWSEDVSGEFSTEIRIELLNQRGTLATIASTISGMGSNIENVSLENQDDRVSVDLITLTVKDRVHLANIIRKLKKLFIVLKITRTKA